MREAEPKSLSAAQVAEACNKLLNISDPNDPLKFTHSNTESALNKMCDASRTLKSSEPNKTDEHPQGWKLAPPTLTAKQKAETKRFLGQISRAAYKLPFSQAQATLKKCLAIVRRHGDGE
jgi:hypothetical protein